MHISGDHPSLGGIDTESDIMIQSSVSGTLQMTRNIKNTNWLKKKYGEGIKPYELCVKMKNPPMDKINDMNLLTIEYNYQFVKGGKNEMCVEAYPQRTLQVQDPNLYRGQLGACKNAAQVNTEKIFIVNGEVEKIDGNFLRSFNVTKIDKTGLFVGSYPLDD